jgi:iron-sulfur cluster assembly accessory protein
MSTSIDPTVFTVTDRAANRISQIVAKQSVARAFRVEVLAGGCSGFQYKFDLESEIRPDDHIVEHGGACVLIDPASLDLLSGSQLDFTEELIGAHFAIRNPNATASCGCGTSFSIG